MLRYIFNPWLIVGAVGTAVILLAATLALLWYTRPDPAPSGPATAVLNVIPAPSATPPPPTATATRIVEATATQNVPPSPPPGNIGIGAYVQISGTGGDGLRFRSDPGLDGEIRMLGAESEVFLVRDGPVEQDDYTWWFLIGPYDETRRGWAVANYLSVVQNP